VGIGVKKIYYLVAVEARIAKLKMRLPRTFLMTLRGCLNEMADGNLIRFLLATVQFSEIGKLAAGVSQNTISQGSGIYRFR
jgi:hypothetical protein